MVVGIAGEAKFLGGAGSKSHEFREDVGTGGVAAERFAHQDMLAELFDEGKPPHQTGNLDTRSR